jgi:putative proteasome-type protease
MATYSDRVLRVDTPDMALKLAYLAFDSTRISAVDVISIDVVLYKRDSYEIVQHRFERSDLSIA